LQLKQEQLDGVTVDVLEMRHFNGLIFSAGLGAEVPTDELGRVLSDRIRAARPQVQDVSGGERGHWQVLAGLTLRLFGIMAVIFLLAVLFKTGFAGKGSKEFQDKVSERMPALETDQIGEQQLRVLEKATKQSVAAELLAKRNELLTLVAILSAAFLLGNALILHANNKILKKRIIRLEARWADVIESDGAKQEDKA
jgi:hypothetical protein